MTFIKKINGIEDTFSNRTLAWGTSSWIQSSAPMKECKAAAVVLAGGRAAEHFKKNNYIMLCCYYFLVLPCPSDSAPESWVDSLICVVLPTQA